MGDLRQGNLLDPIPEHSSLRLGMKFWNPAC